MLGRKQRMINRLEREGVRARATVVEIAKFGTENRSEGFNPIGEKLGLDSKTGYYATRKATLRVCPQGEPEFEVQGKFRFAEYGRTIPKAGERIDVLYDPDDHEQVCVGPPTAEEEQARTAAALSEGRADQAQAMLEQAQRFMGGAKKEQGR